MEKDKGIFNAVICDFGLARVKETKVFFIFFSFLFLFFSFQIFFSPFNQSIHFFFLKKKVQTQKLIDVKGFSPRYTAPEVFGKVTTSIANVSIEYEMKGDVYSFALIIWEMMSRKIPWAHCIISFLSSFTFYFLILISFLFFFFFEKIK